MKKEGEGDNNRKVYENRKEAGKAREEGSKEQVYERRKETKKETQEERRPTWI